MKKIYVILLSLIIFLLGVSCVNAGIIDDLFDNFFPEEYDSSNPKFIDVGTSNNCSNEWYILPKVTKIVTNNGTLVFSGDDQGIYANNPTSSKDKWEDLYDWSTPFTVEFDVVEWNGTPFIRITNETVDISQSFSDLNIKNGSHVKIISSDDNVVFNIDGNKLTPINKKLTDAQIGFRLNNATLKYTNFKIY